MNIEKWAERIYSEEDLGKNIGISLSGSIGLIVYICTSHFELSAFISIIIFPPIKLISNYFGSKFFEKRRNQRLIEERAKVIENVHSLSGDERRVIHEFIKAGSLVLTETYAKLNSIHIPDLAVKSLNERGYLHISETGDNGYELRLNIAIYDAAKNVFKNKHS